MLAQLNREDIVCTGMCFADATSYPSITHPNGDSIDTRYLGTEETRGLTLNQLLSNYDGESEEDFAQAFVDIGFDEVMAGSNSLFDNLDDIVHRRNVAHNNHLHAGNFNINRVQSPAIAQILSGDVKLW